MMQKGVPRKMEREGGGENKRQNKTKGRHVQNTFPLKSRKTLKNNVTLRNKYLVFAITQ